MDILERTQKRMANIDQRHIDDLLAGRTKWVETHIDDVKIGDSVLDDGAVKTVGRCNFGRDAFMGTSLFGNYYRLGTDPVIVVRHKTPAIPLSQHPAGTFMWV